MIVLPILFRPAMVRAILREIEARGSGKTQTRRPAWRDCPACPGIPSCKRCGGRGALPTRWKRLYDRWAAGERDARIWVRESYLIFDSPPGSPAPQMLAYDDEIIGGEPQPRENRWTYRRPGRWPSIRMPRAASRITLEVTDLRLERVQDISADDIEAEGVYRVIDDQDDARDTHLNRGIFADLWDSIHGRGAWEANPELVAVTFTPHLVNVDQWRPPA